MPVLIFIGEILEAGWAWLCALGPWIGRVAPWLLTFGAALQAWGRQVLAYIIGDSMETIVRGTAAYAIRIAVLAAWGIFLAAVFTGISGLSIKDYLSQNPFSGFPAAMMCLVVAAFPVKFAVGLAVSYVVFKLTLAQAALIMARTVKFLFGA
jgi:hypothetical protein